MRHLSSFQMILLLILVALLAGNIYFGVMCFRAYRSEGPLAQDIATIEAQIAAMAQLHNVASLEAELASLEQELDDAPFPRYVDTNEIFDIVERSAARAGVGIDSWAAGDVSQRGVDGSAYRYRVYSYEVAVSGAMYDIFRFLTQIEDNVPYDTFRIDDVGLTYDSATGDWSIAFEILVFAQPE